MEPLTRTVRARDLEFDLVDWSPSEPPRHTVLALHGFPESPWEWRDVAAELVAQGVRVLAPAQRGYSPGARPGEVSDYALPELGADVLAIADELGLSEIDLLSHDWGASVSWWLAAHHPDRIRTQTVVSVPHLGVFNKVLKEDEDQQLRSLYITFFWKVGEAEDSLLADDSARLREAFGGDVPADLVDKHLEVLGSREALTAALNWYRAMSGSDSRIGEVAVPTTYIWGAQDQALGPTAARRSGEGVTADYRFVELPEDGHWVPEVRPDLVAAETLLRIAASSPAP